MAKDYSELQIQGANIDALSGSKPLSAYHSVDF